ncbi:RHS repeat domain-containing protein [Actinocatenispora comari]|uniref:Intein C-terminal splicing domain-containing protein n=1 Tax=Actinocatenispora comari TaxID=2807577 RepID=A0A8J4ADC1_9ACTN|nr:RHS repeat-associated core domain-containing protein [Actinocatenispora comari]GIL28963.1 hypothetical protein NUM_42170 [Actinocatenispora comari]
MPHALLRVKAARSRRRAAVGRWAASAGAALLAGCLLVATPAAAAPGSDELWSPFPLPETPSVPVTNVNRASSASTHSTMRSTAPRAPHWPTAGSATIGITPIDPADAAIAAAAGHPGQHRLATAAGIPVSVSAPGTLTTGRLPVSTKARSAAKTASAAAATRQVKVAVTSRAQARRAGVDGLVVSVAPVDTTGKSGVSVGVDYSAIVDAYGGDYAARLHLVRLPNCVLTTPTVKRCQRQTPVAASSNDLTGGQLVADLTLPAASGTDGGAVVLAAVGGAGSGAGTYAATPLKASGDWSVGNTGAFSYSYPITVPPALGGDGPGVALSYSSSSVDGRTSANNSQASWIGDGWDYTPGFIERSYKSCDDDGHDAVFENCWAGDNATLSLGGKSNRLVPTGSGNTWRLSDDDGSLVEQIDGASNGLHAGTYWKVTTQDGTVYLFGAEHLPTANGGDGSDDATNAAWGAPVYGDDDGEPCHAGTFDASRCTQGWRWNLDFVIDTHHDITVYHYRTETNYYGAGTTHTPTSYVRGGVPTSISYGQQVADYVAGKNPAAQVLFGVAQRCDTTGGFDCSKALSKDTASHWPDVPYDQHCDSSGTCDTHNPTFWSQLRLSTITTRVWDLSLSTPGWSTVDKYTLSQTYPDPGDIGQGGTYEPGKAMWLASIQHTGADTRGGGSSVALDKTTFDGKDALANRVDGIITPSDVAPIRRFRLFGLTTETGEKITVTYDTTATTGCDRSSPPTEDNDTRPCYPVRWTPDGYTDPILDWFYTYPVTEVDENDNGDLWTADQSPAKVTTYSYSGAAWHRDDSEFTPTKTRTWGQFRGYHAITTRTGKTPDPITQSTSWYLQGMNGDVRKDGSKRSVSFTDSAGDTITDNPAWNGTSYQTTTYSSDGGSAQTQTMNHPWQSAATATKTRSGLPDLIARYSNTDRVDTRDKLADGTWRTAETVTTFDNGTGLATAVDDKGQIDADGKPVGGTTPEKCTHTRYATDTDRNIRSLPAEVITNQGACSSTVGASTLSASRTYYDGSTTLGTVTAAGDATTSQALKTASPAVTWAAASTSTYDVYGRVTKTVDPLGRATSTSYGDTATARQYLPVSGSVTNPKGWTTSTTYDPGRQLPLASTDVNNRLTTETYDGLGRLTQVWLPSHPKATYASTPSMKFSYATTNDAYVAVTTQTLHDSGLYDTDIKIYDSLLRLRQEQSMPRNGATHARLIAATAYDSHGWTIDSVQAFYNTESDPATTPIQIVPSKTPAETRTSFDGQGRATASTLYSNSTAQWTTTTAYPGADETDTTPPAGGTPTATITDARGQKTQLRQFHGAAATGAYDLSYYSYDAAGRQTKLVGPLAQSANPSDSKLLWTTSYDAAGNTVKATDPDTGTTTSNYNDDNEQVSSTDNAGQTLSTDYDVLGRKTAVHNGDTSGPIINAWSYDTADGGKGQLATATTYAADGTTPTWTHSIAGYNAFGKPTGETTTVPAGAYGNTAAISYATTTSYSPVMGLPNTTTIKETGTNNLIGTETYGIGYNETGLPVTTGGLDTYVTWANYDPHGRLIRATDSVMPKQVAVTNNWDEPTGRLLNATVSKEDGNAAVDSTTYTYNPAGQVTSATDTQDGGGTASTDRQCFDYDYLGRITNAWTDAGATHTAPTPSVQGVGGCDTTDPSTASLSGPAPYWQSYSYDLTGNRIASTDHATTPGGADRTTTETYDGLDTQHAVHTVTNGDTTTSWDYDADGRPTGTTTATGGTVNPDTSQAFTWNAAGKLATLTTGTPDQPKHSTGYGYDADGNLIARTTDGMTTVYLGGDAIQLSGGSVTEIDRTYDFPDGPSAVRVATTSGSSLHWQAADPHGTGTVDITADGLAVTRRLYTPFGQDRTPTTSQGWAGDKGFVGGTRDDTNQLTNLGARQYSATLGRFLNPDPLLDHDSPQQWNGYAYSNNAPPNSCDPDGRMIRGDDGRGYGTAKQVDKANREYYWMHPERLSKNDPNYSRTGPKMHPTKSCKSGIYGPGGACLDAKMPQVRQGNLTNGSDAYALALASQIHASCFFDKAQIICTGSGSVYSRPITIGDILFYPNSSGDLGRQKKFEAQRRAAIAKKASKRTADIYGPNLLRHEAVHSDQWTHFSSVGQYAAVYYALSLSSLWHCGDAAICNLFEVQANLYWGGYKDYRYLKPSAGSTPRPVPGASPRPVN